VLYASQTGTAQEIARNIQACMPALFVASSYKLPSLGPA